MAHFEHGLGRIPSPEDKRNFLMSAAMAVLPEVPLQDRQWRCARVLDQGQEPECVGFSCAHLGIAAPVERAWTNAMGRSIYRGCKAIDGNPDEPGSTVHAGAKVLRSRGFISTYFFAASVDEALEYVSRYSPVVFGTLWTEGMSTPSPFTHTIRPTGKVRGGHAYAVTGVQWKRKRARIHQSWGADWGDNGECWISIADLRAVYRAGGEALAATETALAIGGV